MTLKNNIKVVLFGALLVAMILPFSLMSMAEAVPHDKSKDTAHNKNKIAKERSDRSLRVDPTPAKYHEIKDKTSKIKHAIKDERKNRPKPPPPSLGTGHEGFGTLLNKSTSSITGVYSKNQVHISGVTLKDNSYLYAPTTFAPNYSGWEVTTFYAH